MSVLGGLRRTAIAALPAAWQPVALFQYYSWRGTLERELPWAVSRVRAGSRAIDVGANEGVYTHALARAGALVEAFEPQPRYAPQLSGYARAHSAVRLHTMALGAKAGSAELFVPVVAGEPVGGHASLREQGGPAQRHRVEVRTLDSFEFGDVSLIKIDVEGHEPEVLAGAHDTIARCRPALLVEIEERHLNRPIRGVLDEIEALGYRGEFLADQQLRPVADFSVEKHQRAEHADIPGAPYVNNFLFTARR